MAAVCLTEQVDCLSDLGQFDKAVEKYEEVIKLDEQKGSLRNVAIGKSQLADVLRKQGKYESAIAEYKAAKVIIEQQNDSTTVAAICHKMGMVYQDLGNYVQAETAYRQALDINTQHNRLAGQASNLGELGLFYMYKLDRPADAVAFYRQSATIHVRLADLRYEWVSRSNIADALIKLERYDEARTETLRSIECSSKFEHIIEQWKTFAILQKIEIAQNNPAAAKIAWTKAKQTYLAYRQRGGYAQTGLGRLADNVLALIE